MRAEHHPGRARSWLMSRQADQGVGVGAGQVGARDGADHHRDAHDRRPRAHERPAAVGPVPARPARAALLVGRAVQQHEQQGGRREQRRRWPPGCRSPRARRRTRTGWWPAAAPRRSPTRGTPPSRPRTPAPRWPPRSRPGSRSRPGPGRARRRTGATRRRRSSPAWVSVSPVGSSQWVVSGNRVQVMNSAAAMAIVATPAGTSRTPGVAARPRPCGRRWPAAPAAPGTSRRRTAGACRRSRRASRAPGRPRWRGAAGRRSWPGSGGAGRSWRDSDRSWPPAHRPAPITPRGVGALMTRFQAWRNGVLRGDPHDRGRCGGRGGGGRSACGSRGPPSPAAAAGPTRTTITSPKRWRSRVVAAARRRRSAPPR